MEIETWSETSFIQTLYIFKLFHDSDNLALFKDDQAFRIDFVKAVIPELQYRRGDIGWELVQQGQSDFDGGCMG